MGVLDRPPAGHTGAMINLRNMLSHKLDAAFGVCPPLYQEVANARHSHASVL
jgi:hypothetical protein